MTKSEIEKQIQRAVDVRTECKSARALREQLEQQLCATALPQSTITERSPRRRKRKKAPKS